MTGSERVEGIQPLPRVIVVMGPSGVGKSTLGRALAEATGRRFIEGDDHHLPESRATMAAGVPLGEAERIRFLDRLGQELARTEGPLVSSCSALRRTHRERLRAHAGEILFVWPELERDELARRLRDRADHFMPPTQLEHQLATFEPPSADETVMRIEGTLPVAAQVRQICFTPR